MIPEGHGWGLQEPVTIPVPTYPETASATMVVCSAMTARSRTGGGSGRSAVGPGGESSVGAHMECPIRKVVGRSDCVLLTLRDGT